jgi:hypothetical protein
MGVWRDPYSGRSLKTEETGAVRTQLLRHQTKHSGEQHSPQTCFVA